MKENLRFIDQFEKGKVFTNTVDAVCDRKIPSLCKAPYYNHPNGCPNYGKNPNCPPNLSFFPEKFKREVNVVAVWLDFKSYLDVKRLIHSEWNERKLRNLRHWQNHMDSYLFEFVNEVTPKGKTFIFNSEGMGVNLFETCKKVGIYLERYPINRVYRVGLFVEAK